MYFLLGPPENITAQSYGVFQAQPKSFKSNVWGHPNRPNLFCVECLQVMSKLTMSWEAVVAAPTLRPTLGERHGSQTSK